jgi:hypothetical protein
MTDQPTAEFTAGKPCRCHSNESLYGTLKTCPACGHRSLDVGTRWAGCERRKCGAEYRRHQDGLWRPA